MAQENRNAPVLPADTTLGVPAETLGQSADSQLRAFRRKAGHGQVCDTGLWSLSRHPNYLGEWLFWLGLALFALPGWILFRDARAVPKGG